MERFLWYDLYDSYSVFKSLHINLKRQNTSYPLKIVLLRYCNLHVQISRIILKRTSFRVKPLLSNTYAKLKAHFMKKLSSTEAELKNSLLIRKACSTEGFRFWLNNYKSAHLTFTKRKSIKQSSFHADFEDGGHYGMSDWGISLIDQTKIRSLK